MITAHARQKPANTQKPLTALAREGSSAALSKRPDSSVDLLNRKRKRETRGKGFMEIILPSFLSSLARGECCRAKGRRLPRQLQTLPVVHGNWRTNARQVVYRSGLSVSLRPNRYFNDFYYFYAQQNLTLELYRIPFLYFYIVAIFFSAICSVERATQVSSDASRMCSVRLEIEEYVRHDSAWNSDKFHDTFVSNGKRRTFLKSNEDWEIIVAEEFPRKIICRVWSC